MDPRKSLAPLKAHKGGGWPRSASVSKGSPRPSLSLITDTIKSSKHLRCGILFYIFLQVWIIKRQTFFRPITLAEFFFAHGKGLQRKSMRFSSPRHRSVPQNESILSAGLDPEQDIASQSGSSSGRTEEPPPEALLHTFEMLMPLYPLESLMGEERANCTLGCFAAPKIIEGILSHNWVHQAEWLTSTQVSGAHQPSPTLVHQSRCELWVLHAIACGPV